MTKISSSLVAELRKITDAGIMDCKKALLAANGDIEQAIEGLRNVGQAKAVKKSGRIAAEGLVAIAINNLKTQAYILEINCETDFVAREEKFQEFCKQLAQLALSAKVTSIEELSKQKLDNATVEEQRLELISKVGENISLRRLEMLTCEPGASIGEYLHGGAMVARIGSLVALNTNDLELAHDVAMQVAAMKPEFIDESQIPAERLAKEKEFFMTQAREEHANKPDDVLEKIIAGKLKKFIKEVTLADQAFFKDTDKTMQQLLDSKNAQVVKFIRYEVGEGIEKKEDDFANEVMAQVNA